MRKDRIKDDSRKGAKDAKFGEIGKYFSLRSWRDEEKIGEKITLAKAQRTPSSEMRRRSIKDDSRKGAKGAKC